LTDRASCRRRGHRNWLRRRFSGGRIT